MYTKYLIPILALLFLMACSNGFEERPFSDYVIDNDALKDGEMLEIIYSPGAPDYNPDLTYYVNMIVVSQETGDTVNLLTPNIFDITETDNKRNFISSESDSYKLSQNGIMEPGTYQIDDIELKQINTVLVSKKGKHIEQNNFPTVIGSLGIVLPLPGF